MQRYPLFFLIFMYFIPSIVYAKDGLPELKFKGLLDGRLTYSDTTLGWLDDGLGKTRYGGSDNGGNQTEPHLAEASLIMLPRINWSLSGNLHLKFDEEQRHPLDMVEAFLKYRPVPTSQYRFRARFGAFFPPISFENKALAWTSPYTLSSSAINSWIGEELRVVGGEASIIKTGDNNTFAITGSAFMANDPAGTLLAWRGWSIHSRKTTLFDRLPLADIPSILPGGSFDKQAPWLEPFHEIDDRIGFYTGCSWKYLNFSHFRALYYDNRADLKGFDGDQYAWDTRFTSLGLSLNLPNQFEFISQYMFGDSSMGLTPEGQIAVDIDFRSFFALISKRLNKHRFSMRYDRFVVDDRDNTPDDDNNERGHGLTWAYTFKTTEKQRLVLEALRVKSDRPVRESLGFEANKSESLFQVGYKIFF